MQTTVFEDKGTNYYVCMSSLSNEAHVMLCSLDLMACLIGFPQWLHASSTHYRYLLLFQRYSSTKKILVHMGHKYKKNNFYFVSYKM